MFVGCRVFLDGAHMYSAFMGKRALPDKRTLIQRRHVGNLAHIAGEFSELFQFFFCYAKIPHFQLEIPDNRDQVHIPATLSITVDSALDHSGT